MKHRLSGKKLSRTSKHRKALYKNLAKAVVLHGEVVTTQAKAKAVTARIQKLITTAKKGTLSSRRQLHAFFNDSFVTNKLVDYLAPRIKDRKGGYLSITTLENRRGDDATMARISMIDISATEPVETKPETKKVSKKEAVKSK